MSFISLFILVIILDEYVCDVELIFAIAEYTLLMLYPSIIIPAEIINDIIVIIIVFIFFFLKLLFL